MCIEPPIHAPKDKFTEAMSGLNFGNLATQNTWGGNVGDYAFIFIATLATYVVAWFTMHNYGFTFFQTQAGSLYRYAQVRALINWAKKQRTSEAKQYIYDLRYIFGSVWFTGVFRMSDLTQDLAPEQKMSAKRAYTQAMEWSSYVQAFFAYLIGAFFFVMVFFTWYTPLYDNAGAIGPGTDVAGWYIALIVLVALVLLFHKTATILTFTNWYPPRVVGYIVEFIAILLCLGVLICSAVLATTEAWGFIGTAVTSGLLIFILALYLIWVIIHGRAILFFYERMDRLSALKAESPSAGTPAASA